MKYTIQYVTGILVFLLSTIATWYEGSELRDTPWEWNYSAIFSKMIHGGSITSEADIISMDHYIYAAKFEPLFPFLMVASLLFLVTFTFFHCFKSKPNVMIGYSIVMGAVLLSASVLLSGSPTPGLRIFTWVFVSLGIGGLYGAFMFTKLHKTACI